MKRTILVPFVALLTLCSALTLAPANAAPVQTGYTASEYRDFAGAANYLGQTPEFLQRFGVATIRFLIAITGQTGRQGQNFSQDVSVAGEYQVLSQYLGEDLNAIREVMAFHSVSPQQAQKIGAAFMTFISGIDARNRGINIETFKPNLNPTTTTTQPPITTTPPVSQPPAVDWNTWATAHYADLTAFKAPNSALRTPVCLDFSASATTLLKDVNEAIAGLPTAVDAKRTEVLAFLNAAKASIETAIATCNGGQWWGGRGDTWDAANYATAAGQRGKDEAILDTDVNSDGNRVTVTPTTKTNWPAYFNANMNFVEATVGDTVTCSNINSLRGPWGAAVGIHNSYPTAPASRTPAMNTALANLKLWIDSVEPRVVSGQPCGATTTGTQPLGLVSLIAAIPNAT